MGTSSLDLGSGVWCPLLYSPQSGRILGTLGLSGGGGRGLPRHALCTPRESFRFRVHMRHACVCAQVGHLCVGGMTGVKVSTS